MAADSVEVGKNITTNTARAAAGRKNNAMVTGDSVENFFLWIGGQSGWYFYNFLEYHPPTR
jgi:hypothetical protein